MTACVFFPLHLTCFLLLPEGAATDHQDTLPLENIEMAPVPTEPVAPISSPNVPADTKRGKYQHGKGKAKDDELRDDAPNSAKGTAPPDQDAAIPAPSKEEQGDDDEEDEASRLFGGQWAA